MVFYHGKEKWEVHTFDSYFPGIDTLLYTFIPCFNIILTDITGIPDEQITDKLFDREANKVLFLIMKHIFDTDYLEKHLQDFLEIGKKYFQSKDGIGFLKTILIYLFTTIESKKEKIIHIVNKISKQEGELAMTIAMQLKEEGIKEGIKKGIKETAKKMILKGYSIKEICDVTGLEPGEVEKLKAEE